MRIHVSIFLLSLLLTGCHSFSEFMTGTRQGAVAEKREPVDGRPFYEKVPTIDYQKTMIEMQVAKLEKEALRRKGLPEKADPEKALQYRLYSKYIVEDLYLNEDLTYAFRKKSHIMGSWSLNNGVLKIIDKTGVVSLYETPDGGNNFYGIDPTRSKLVKMPLESHFSGL